MNMTVKSFPSIETLQYVNPKFPLSEFIDCFDLLPDLTYPSHWHHEFEIQLILEGSAKYTVNGQQFTIPKGSAIYIAPEAVHTMKALEAGTIGYNIIISSQFMVDLMQMIGCEEYAYALLFKDPDAYHVTSSQKTGYRIISLLRQLYSTEHSMHSYELFLLSKVVEIWHCLHVLLPKAAAAEEELSDSRENRMRTMLDFIHANYVRPITVQEIADAASVSKTECYRCFTDFSVMSPNEYLNTYRLKKAAQLLLTGNDEISRICYDVGFNSTSYFAKKFKELYQMTPKEYRTLRSLDR